MSLSSYDTIVLGAGAAGLMCALKAGGRGRRVLLIERSDKVGEKIRISGGGRSNFTNIYTEATRYLSNNPRFCYSALARYTPQDFIRWIESHGIAYHEKKLGQLFCDGSAQQIIDALVADCEGAGVTILTRCTVNSVQKTDRFALDTSKGPFDASTFVVATGGLSIPKMGATDFGYRLAEQFGLPIVPCAPALVPFTLDDHKQAGLDTLSGSSFDAVASIGKQRFEEAVLITHRGLSGPAILQISSYWEPGKSVRLDLFPDLRLDEVLMETKRKQPKINPSSFLRSRLSARFAGQLCEQYGWTVPFGEMADKKIRAMADALQRWDIPIKGTEGYAKAEVTRGGVDTKSLSPKTMEAKKVPGLFFIGEVVDVTGWLGGYNFQWAWASAAAAAEAV